MIKKEPLSSKVLRHSFLTLEHFVTKWVSGIQLCRYFLGAKLRFKKQGYWFIYLFLLFLFLQYKIQTGENILT